MKKKIILCYVSRTAIEDKLKDKMSSNVWQNTQIYYVLQDVCQESITKVAQKMQILILLCVRVQ